MIGKRILVCSYAPPSHDRDSGSRRSRDFIDFLLAAGSSVTFLSAHPLQESPYTRELQQAGIAVYDGSGPEVEELIAEGRFDLALCSFWQVAELFLPPIRRTSPSTRIVVDSVDLQFVRDARRILGDAGRAEDGRLLDAGYALELTGELNTYAAADLVLAVSEEEATLLDNLIGKQGALCVPLAEAMERSTLRFSDRSGVLFVGSFRHPPNVDALGHLCTDIVPLLDEELLDRHPISIVGDGLDASIRELLQRPPGVELLGWVPSLRPYLERARISIVPLRYGAGTKGKLVQSLLAGTPAVSTTVGIEGLGLRDERDVLVADEAPAFARSLEHLLTDEQLWRRLSRNGRSRVAATHSRDVVRQRFLAALEAALARDPKPRLLREAGRERFAARNRYQEQQKLLPGLLKLVERKRNGASTAAGLPARLIAFYLPQFHPIPENDAWWGKGFTEWTNVARAQPLFEGHYQPRIPADLGFYDLRLPDTRVAQAELARASGISAFCYYHFWFGGKRLLGYPFDEVLASGEPDFPFCLCWANEPWSRRWDGSEQDVLQPQSYSDEDDVAHIRWLIPALTDPRALTVEGKPLFLVYRATDLPDPGRTAQTWRDELDRAGLPGLFLVAVETGWDLGRDLTDEGFDAKVYFQPQFSVLDSLAPFPVDAPRTLRVFHYDEVWPSLASPDPVSYRRYETVCTGWDNSPRTDARGWVLHGSSPEAYERWLRGAIARVRDEPSDHRLVFLNAWNEWAEGAYLEPDQRNGRAYLEATRGALDAEAAGSAEGIQRARLSAVADP